MSKKRAGNYKTPKIKSTDYLPQVFRTKLNTSWLDSTFDQMISKGNLRHSEGFVGSRTGGARLHSDIYIDPKFNSAGRKTSQLAPGIVLRNDNGDISQSITLDDIANNISVNFEKFNFNAAYATEKYVYTPPINVDKFVNYSTYVWMQNMPIYESVRTLEEGHPLSGVNIYENLPGNPTLPGATYTLGINEPTGTTDPDVSNNGMYTGYTEVINPINASTDHLTWTVEDNNNTFDLEDQMLVTFVGDGYTNDVKGTVYLVTGVGDSIELIPYVDLVTNTYVYPTITQTSTVIAGLWDNSNILTVKPNTQNKYWQSAPIRGPIAIKAAYNADPDKLPIFDGYIFDGLEGNNTQFTPGILIRFSDDWDMDPISYYKVGITEISETSGNIDVRIIIDAVFTPSGGVRQFLHPSVTPEEFEQYKDRLIGYDSNTWDTGTIVIAEQDYQTISRSSTFHTAWSRNNFWVSEETIKRLGDLIPGLDTGALLVESNYAKRPIIEFSGDIDMWGFASFNPDLEPQWLGMVDYIIDPVGEYTPEFDILNNLMLDHPELNVGDTIIFKSDDPDLAYVFKVSLHGYLEPVTHLQKDHIAYVKNVLQDHMKEWTNTDIWFTGTEWNLGLQRTDLNQMPLFRLYTIDNIPLEDIPGSVFKGSRVFNYRVGTGKPDAVLGYPLVYRDVNGRAEYEFENYIITEKHMQSFASDFDRNVNYYSQIKGEYMYRRGVTLHHLYRQSEVMFGAEQTYTTDITSVDEDIVLPIGYSSWRPRREILLHTSNIGSIRTTELVYAGQYLNKTNIGNELIFAGNNQTIYLHNLIVGRDIEFLSVNGTNIEANPALFPGVNITRYNNSVILELNNVTIDKIRIRPVGVDPIGEYIVVVVDNIDSIYHSVRVNGKLLTANNYTIENNRLIIPKELVSVNDIVDLKYYSKEVASPKLDIAAPHCHLHNPKNELLKTFTMSETLAHWKSMIEHTPGFEGDVFGINNYNHVYKKSYFGGEIFVHQNPAIMHDMLYADNKLSITGALVGAGEDWDNFRNRFINQVKRLYSKKSYSRVSDLVNDAIESIIVSRKGSDIYKNSNMVYNHKHNVKEYIIENQTLPITLFLNNNINGDVNTRDHVYVYLIDNLDQNGVLVERLLTKDVDYIQAGSMIILKVVPNIMPNGSLPKVRVHYHNMDELSYVPPSLVKLKLKQGYVPQQVDNKILTHDGRLHTIRENSSVIDINDQNFDHIAAAILELEKRIYAGLTVSDDTYTEIDSRDINISYGNVYTWLPAQNRETWYTLDIVNDYIRKYYANWKLKTQKTEYTVEFDEQDPTTWNYSSIEIGEHFTGNKLPGHWKGAYVTLFGTETPHLTPWHMLGYGFKPTWWDDLYSWTDQSKREALIIALKNGVISRLKPITDVYRHVIQDVTYANYYWDFETRCPVDTNGDLVSPELVLGTPSDINKAAPFVFGDWAGLEYEWRTTASGHAALVDAVTKLNPTRAFTSFYQPDRIEKYRQYINAIDAENKTIIKPSNYPVPGKVYNNSVLNIKFKNTVDRFSDRQFIQFVDGDKSSTAHASIAFEYRSTVNDNGVIYRFANALSLTNRGRGFTSEPSVYSDFTQTQIDNTDLEIEIGAVEYVASGISQALFNYIVKNNLSYSLDNLHNKLDTHLTYKLEGFSSKHLLGFDVESYNSKNYILSENDYEILMYKGSPTDIHRASIVNIKKTELGYIVDGLSLGRQEFYFLEPDITNKHDYKDVTINNSVLRRYKKFSPVYSIAEYGTRFSKIQDTYNFLRGYWKYLESVGYILETNGDSSAAEFVKWAINADDNEEYTLDLGHKIQFKCSQGVVEEIGNGIYRENNIIDKNGNIIDKESIIVDRVGDTIVIEDNELIGIGAIGLSVINYEHAVVFADKTSFGIVMHDDVKSIGQERILVNALITDEWTGKKSAPGYLIFDNKIVENFDSAVKGIDDFYRTDVVDFNPAITKLEDITIGNSNSNITNSTDFESITKRKFFQGLIKEKGTTNSINKIERNYHENNLDISVYEQYMLQRTHFGNVSKLYDLEFTINEDDLKAGNQVIKFSEFPWGQKVYDQILVIAPGDKRIVNEGNTSFSVQPINTQSLKVLTAGEVLDQEVDYQINSLNDIGTVFDTTADYANIETWSYENSYKYGDIVRYNGGLYRCIVNSTTATEASDDIIVTGTTTNPTFPYGTVATIDGVSTVFEKTTTVNNTISALGTVENPTMLPSETLVIDGISIGFTKSEEVQVVIGPAVIRSSLSSPSIPDVTDQFISINGVTVDFDITPEDETQSFVGDNIGVTPSNVTEIFTSGDLTPLDSTQSFIAAAGQTDFEITVVTLSPTTYSVDTVLVNGTPLTNSEFTVNGQIVELNLPLTGGEDVEITLTHVPVAQKTFTINQSLSPTTYSVALVTVNGSSATFTLNNQNITITSAVSIGDSVVVTLSHQPVIDLKDTFTITAVSLSTYFVKDVKVDGNTVPATEYTVSGQLLKFNAGSEPADGAAILVTLAHIPVSIDTQQIIDIINSYNIQGIVARSTIEFDRLEIEFTTTNPNELLVIGSSSTNSTIGISAGATRPLTEWQTQLTNMSLNEIVEFINLAESLANVTADSVDNKLRLTSTNSSLTVTGSARTILGLNSTYQAGTVTLETYTNMLEAVALINSNLAANGKEGVFLTINSNRINIASDNESLDLGNTTFNSIAGIPTGIISRISTTGIESYFVIDEWEDISHEDPAMFQIWMTDDSTYEVQNIGTIKTKFNGWNVMQVQNHNKLYTVSDDIECGICAGTATRDGNDAEITVQTDHNLVPGDYVMLLNTTTVPNIDGIHKVTRVIGSRTFYIDRFIEKCGNAVSVLPLRTMRFETLEERDTAFASISWFMVPGSYTWVDYDTYGNDKVRSINVWEVAYAISGEQYTSGAGKTMPVQDVFVLERQQYNRITNWDLTNIIIYDKELNQPILTLEKFDPLRGHIPGIAEIELDIKSVHDVAVYNVSTDNDYTPIDDSAWSSAEVGKRWLDVRNMKYYDYDQGNIDYRSKYWGKLFPGSDVTVWEWTKSNVPPDDYAKSVESEKEMFGVIATGEAYSTFDPILNEQLYYYTQTSEWNQKLSKYQDVYYFWVKNKETISSKNRILNTRQIESIIKDPSANGINWFSVADNDSIIISNIAQFVNKEVVVQLNRDHSSKHSNWQLLTKGVDTIPNYWYIGLRNNLAMLDNYDKRLPDQNLHVYARYGDDRSKRQGWFDDIVDARTNALTVINDQLKTINVYQDYKTRFIDAINNSVISNNEWDWTDYVLDGYSLEDNYSIDVDSISELHALDTNEYQNAMIEIISSDDNYNRTEYYHYDADSEQWLLVKKLNSAIKFNETYLRRTYTWDMDPWDIAAWDNVAIADMWRDIIDICRNILFVNEHAYKFNILFFAMIDYTLSRFTQVDWINKSSYIRVEIKTALSQPKKYIADVTNNVIGYVNDIKPFHVKISDTKQQYNSIEDVDVSVTEDVLKNISIMYQGFDPLFSGNTYDANTTNEKTKTISLAATGENVYIIPRPTAELGDGKWKTSEVRVGTTVMTPDLDYYIVNQTITFFVPPADTVYIDLYWDSVIIVDGGSFATDDTQYEDTVDGADFIAPESYIDSHLKPERLTELLVRPQEVMSVTVDDTDTNEVFVYLHNLIRDGFKFNAAQTTTLTADINVDDNIISVGNVTAIANATHLLINNEVIKVDIVGGIVYIKQRSMLNTLVSTHSIGDTVLNISDESLNWWDANNWLVTNSGY